MAECYYSYSFDLADGLIWEEMLDKNSFSPFRALGLELPVAFEDFIDGWKALCHPIFEDREDALKLNLLYLRDAYRRGERTIAIDLEHNPMKNSYATKYTRIHILMSEQEETERVGVTVNWEKNPELEKLKNGK